MGTQALMWWYGARNKSLPQLFGTGKVEILGVVMTADKIGAVVASVGLLAAVLCGCGRAAAASRSAP